MSFSKLKGIISSSLEAVDLATRGRGTELQVGAPLAGAPEARRAQLPAGTQPSSGRSGDPRGGSEAGRVSE